MENWNEWTVWSGYISYGDWVKEEVVFKGSLADCYAWVECAKGGLFLDIKM